MVTRTLMDGSNEHLSQYRPGLPVPVAERSEGGRKFNPYWPESSGL